jgi:endonuclease YncB( thermonuclease family)
MRVVLGVGLLTMLLVAANGWSQPDIAGEVIAIADGDTFRLLTPAKKQVKIRLAEIDTPERGQPYSNRAREVLAALVFRKSVTVGYVDTDRYGRTVGRVFVGELDVNAEMVRRGAAWVYRKYAKDPLLFKLEEQARAAGHGIWGLPEAQRVPPWEWRRRSRESKRPAS